MLAANEVKFTKLIRELDEWVDSVDPESDLLDGPRSLALSDRASVSGHTIENRALLLPFNAALTLLIARSFLQAIVRCLSLEDATPPAHVLARSALETSAYAWWVLDSDIPVSGRLGRQAASELEGWKERRKLVLDNPSLLPMADADLKRFRQSVATDGIVVAPRPSATDLVGELLDAAGNQPWPGRLTYRMLSALPHGGLHAHSGMEAFESPLAGGSAAIIGFFNAFDRLTRYVNWHAADDWRRWASLVRREGWISFRN